MTSLDVRRDNEMLFLQSNEWVSGMGPRTWVETEANEKHEEEEGEQISSVTKAINSNMTKWPSECVPADRGMA